MCICVAWFMFADKICLVIIRIRSPSRPAMQNARPPHAPPKGPLGGRVLLVQAPPFCLALVEPLQLALQASAVHERVPLRGTASDTRIFARVHPKTTLIARHLGPNSRMRRINLRRHNAMEKSRCKIHNAESKCEI